MKSARISTPEWIERNKTQTLTLVVSHQPASATITVIDASGTELVNAASTTVSQLTLSYSLNASLIPASMSLGENWQVVWIVTFSDGEVVTFARDAALVRRKLQAVITDDDLLSRHSQLTKILKARNTADFSQYRDEAWTSILVRLMMDGRYPYLVLSPWALRLPHIFLTLHLLFTDASTFMPQSGYDQLADDYLKRYDDEWTKLVLTYDLDADGKPDDSETGQAASSGVFLGGSPGAYSWRRF